MDILTYRDAVWHERIASGHRNDRKDECKNKVLTQEIKKSYKPLNSFWDKRTDIVTYRGAVRTQKGSIQGFIRL